MNLFKKTLGVVLAISYLSGFAKAEASREIAKLIKIVRTVDEVAKSKGYSVTQKNVAGALFINAKRIPFGPGHTDQVEIMVEGTDQDDRAPGAKNIFLDVHLAYWADVRLFESAIAKVMSEKKLDHLIVKRDHSRLYGWVQMDLNRAKSDQITKMIEAIDFVAKATAKKGNETLKEIARFGQASQAFHK